MSVEIKLSFPAWLTKGRAIFYSVFGMLSLLASVVLTYWGCASKVMASVDKRIDTRSSIICDTAIAKKTSSIEKMIANQAMIQLKTNTYLESAFTPAQLASARAKWVADSIKLTHQLEALGFKL